MDQFLNRTDVREGVVSLGLAARHDSALFISAFARAWPVEDASQFAPLLQQIDRVDCERPHQFR